MIREEVTMTFFEVLNTYAFWKMMSILWSPIILVVLVWVIMKIYRNRKTEK